MWNVGLHDETLSDSDRTNNVCEKWNKPFALLVGDNHPSVLMAVEAFHTDLAVVEQVLRQAQH